MDSLSLVIDRFARFVLTEAACIGCAVALILGLVILALIVESCDSVPDRKKKRSNGKTATLIAVLSVAMCASAVSQSTSKGTASNQPLPNHVDLRPQLSKFGLMPRSQGHRNTCSVIVTAAALEFALSKHLGKGTGLSPEYLNWACNQVINNRTEDRGQFFHDLLKGFDKYGTCLESEMPYLDRFDPNYKPSEKAIKSAEEVKAKGFKVHWINPWSPKLGLTDEQLIEIGRTLARGYPVAAGASHSRLLVGYQDDPGQPGGGVFLAKDSAAAAYTTVTYQFVKENVADVFWVEVLPNSGESKPAAKE